MLVAGRPHWGNLAPALRQGGWVVDEVDTLIGGEAHDLMGAESCKRPSADRCRMVCTSSCGWEFLVRPSRSCMYGQGRAAPALYMATSWCAAAVPLEWRTYLESKMDFVRLAARMATLAWSVGATFVVENPVDRGMRQWPPPFSWWWRQHVPLWLMPEDRDA